MCVFSQKRYKNISTGLFILWPAPCTSGVTWGCWGSKTWAWRFAMMPSQLHVLITYSSGLDTDVEQLYIIFYCQRKQSEISSYPCTYKLLMLARGAVQLPQNTSDTKHGNSMSLPTSTPTDIYSHVSRF